MLSEEDKKKVELPPQRQTIPVGEEPSTPDLDGVDAEGPTEAEDDSEEHSNEEVEEQPKAPPTPKEVSLKKPSAALQATHTLTK